jgi:cobalt/nickel transport system permease protein
MLLTYRYLHDIDQDWHTMQRAMHLRGFHFSQSKTFWQGKPLVRLASLVGTLLIRSYEQSERIYQAMRLRGYGSSQSLGSRNPRGSFWDWSMLMSVLILAIAFVGAELALQFGL